MYIMKEDNRSVWVLGVWAKYDQPKIIEMYFNYVQIMGRIKKVTGGLSFLIPLTTKARIGEVSRRARWRLRIGNSL